MTDTESLEEYLAFIRHQDRETGSFLEIAVRPGAAGAAGATGDPAEHPAGESPEGSPPPPPRLPLPLAVKDNIAVRGYRLTCGSSMLENLVSPYTATAVERLERAGARVVGKTNLDEFGMGSATENTPLGRTVNPWNHDFVAGGSSGGSAAAVAQQLVPVALGSDTGGSIRQPAAFCGVYGLKPTYGTVSRYGLVAYASSLEVIGVLGADIGTVARTYRLMSGVDGMDHSSVDPPPDGGSPDPVRTVGVLRGDLGLTPEVARNYAETEQVLQARGYRIKPVELTTLEYVVPAYYTIATAEASANLARYNGVRYGYRPDYAENPEELVRKARSEAFGREVKLRILLGTYVLRSGFQDQYYTQAQKIRTLIRRELEQIYREVDVILMPVFPTQAFPRADAEGAPAFARLDEFQQKVADRFTCTANLAALPALTVPTGLARGLPLGMQLMGPAFSEERLFAVAEDLAREMPIQFPRSSISWPEWRAAGGGS
ncbi:MAG: Asp-tRNA(Asn)/Glu-tRNA(Gln) amidotransferase subunit GatA [Spirochaetaceae bacterium]|nr:MAG: Asp-tRNA(Asn)/Glu-tRNA(Gln) amidotransferase subunit GatA [Spirochaetaceae bacterium]